MTPQSTSSSATSKPTAYAQKLCVNRGEFKQKNLPRQQRCGSIDHPLTAPSLTRRAAISENLISSSNPMQSKLHVIVAAFALILSSGIVAFAGDDRKPNPD